MRNVWMRNVQIKALHIGGDTNLRHAAQENELTGWEKPCKSSNRTLQNF